MDVDMEAMMILKDDTAILAEDGKNSQANKDVVLQHISHGLFGPY